MKAAPIALVLFLFLGLQSGRPQSPDGQVDPTFDAGSGINGPVNAAAVYADGRILIGGTFTTVSGANTVGLSLLLTNGATDLTFTNVFTLTDWPFMGVGFWPEALIVQPDGKILVGGYWGWEWGSLGGLMRFQPDGTYDGSFDNWVDATVYSMALQPDGKVIAGGSFIGDVFGVPGPSYLARFNTDGSFDEVFFPVLDDVVTAVALQPDGRILIAGQFTTINGEARPGLARLWPDGTVDSSFQATTSTQWSSRGGVEVIALQADGKILLGGDFTAVNGVAVNRIARLNPDGSLDAAFSAGRAGADSTVSALVVQSSGKIMVGGQFNTINGASQRGLARLNSNGSVDGSFSVGPGGVSGGVNCLAAQPNGQLVAGGNLYSVNNSAVSYLARLGADGALDQTFANGQALFANPATELLPQSDGKILVSGFAGTGIGRLNSDGSVDRSFLKGMSGTSGDVWALAFHQGKILVGGSFTNFNRAECSGLVRLNPDGSLDSGFKNGIGGTSGRVECLAVQADGKIVIGGYFDSIKGFARTNLARLNSDGSLDTSFMQQLAGPDSEVRALEIQQDGRIVIGGNFATVNGVARKGAARLHPDGTLDLSFQADIESGLLFKVLVQPDSKILLGGIFSSVNGIAVAHLARVYPDGKLDTNFNANFGTAWQEVVTIALQSDGRILVGGWFYDLNGLEYRNIARLDTNGVADAFLWAGGGADSIVNEFKILDGSRLLIGGAFNSINGVARKNVARVFYQVSTVPLAFALNNTNLTWTTEGSAAWFGQTNFSHDGVASAQSGSIGDDQVSTLKAAVRGPGTLRFWWKLSCEVLWDYMMFTSTSEFETNQFGITGEWPWVERVVCLPEGVHTLEWSYVKDYMAFEGQDTAWLDEVSYTPGYMAPVIAADPISRTNSAGDQAWFTASAVGSAPLSYQWLLNGVEIPGATNSYCLMESVVPEQAGTYTLRAANPYGAATSAGAQLVVIPARGYGDNAYGQAAVSNCLNAVAIAAGQNHSLLLRADGTIYATGDNSYGQCSPPPNLGPAIGIAGGGFHSLAITGGRTVVGWGDNYYGQTNAPAGLTDVTAVAAGFWHSLALRADGTVTSWGDNTFGQTSVPSGLDNVVAIAAGGNHSLALRADGTVVAWGQNSDAQGIFAGQSTVPWSLNHVVGIAAGEYHSLAVKRDGSVIAWGDNSYGQCNVPTNALPAAAVAGGGTHSLARLVDGTAVGWGGDFFGQSGFPSYLTNVVELAAGNSHSLILFGLRPPPQLQACNWTPNRFSVQVPTFSDRLYSFEYTTSLSSTNWLPLPLIRGLGELQPLTDPGASGPRRFYRVRQW
ncbi:MAG TPA: hypothetical protein VJA21_04165 [Verrucomicrobiae bacterium]